MKGGGDMNCDTETASELLVDLRELYRSLPWENRADVSDFLRRLSFELASSTCVQKLARRNYESL